MVERESGAKRKAVRVMVRNEKGYMPFTGLYSSRYYAKKRAAAGEVVVKTAAGYAIMSKEQYAEYRKEQT